MSVSHSGKQAEKAKARLAEIDIIVSNIYEDKALGRIPEHRYLAMTEKYDAESEKLQSEVEEIENHFSAVDKHFCTGTFHCGKAFKDD